MWQQWVNLVAGLWLVASAYLGMSASAMIANITVSGIIVAALALWGAVQHQSHERSEHEGSYRTT